MREDQKIMLTPDQVDITEAIKILYDTAVQSMDVGSGMLDNEEMENLVILADRLGFQAPPLADAPLYSLARKYPHLYEWKLWYTHSREETPRPKAAR